MDGSIPGIGELTRDDHGGLITPVLPVSLLGKDVSFSIFDYDPQRTDDMAVCIKNFQAVTTEVLHQATNAVYAYYQDVYESVQDDEYTLEWMPVITEPAQVWEYIQLDQYPGVHSGYAGDNAWYIVFECECEWEPEHGLMIVFRNGAEIIKVGPYDGFLTWHEDDRDVSGDGLFRLPG